MVHNVLADRMQQMSLSQADTAIKKERVVRFARSLGHRQRRRVGEIIVVTNDERFKCVLWVENEIPVRIIARRGFVGLLRSDLWFRCCGRGQVTSDVEFYFQRLAGGV